MIDSDFRQNLRATAHHLNALILIGQHGMTDAIIAEIERMLNAHELVKIKWKDSDKESRVQAIDHLCTTLSAQAITHIGKQFVIYRENPNKKREPEQVARKKAVKKPVKNAVAKRCAAKKCSLQAPKKRYYRMAPVNKEIDW